MMQSKFWIQVGGLAVVLSLALMISLQSAQADVPPSEIPEELIAAIDQVVVGALKGEFAGLCEEIEQATSDGKYCANVLSIEDGLARVAIAPVATDEFGVWIFTDDRWPGADGRSHENEWKPSVDDGPRVTPVVPNTGSGNIGVTESNSPFGSLWVALVAITLVVSLGAMTGLRRNKSVIWPKD